MKGVSDFDLTGMGFQHSKVSQSRDHEALFGRFYRANNLLNVYVDKEIVCKRLQKDREPSYLVVPRYIDRRVRQTSVRNRLV